MKSFRQFLTFYTLLLLLLSNTYAQNIFVSSDGNDSATGTLSDPKKSVQAALVSLGAGDTIFLIGGIYHEEVLMKDLSGSENSPIVLSAYANNTVTFDGTVDLDSIKDQGSEWTLAVDSFPGTENIYRIPVKEDIWQLWIKYPEKIAVPNAVGGSLADYRMQVIARWPNGNTNPTDPVQLVPDTTIALPNTWWSFETTWAFASHPETNYTKIVNSPVRFDLAGSGKCFQGGTAVLSAIKQGPANFPVKILAHKSGSNEFVHSGIDEEYGLYTYPSVHGPSYFIQHLQALDQPGEWYYDQQNKMVYLWPENNANPNTLDIRGKNQTYAFDIQNCTNIIFNGIGFFGTSLKLDGEYISIINGAISYPDMPKSLLGEYGFVIPAIDARNCRYFTMRNCIVEYSQSHLIEVKNVGSVFENNYFHHLSMTGYGASGCFLNVNTFKYNTLHTIGNRAAVKCNSSPESGRIQSWNILMKWGFLFANDGVGFQTSQGGSVNSVRAYNWFLSSGKPGHRYDGPEEGLGFPTLGLSHHLVGLRTASVSTNIKGDYNQVYHYLAIKPTSSHGGIAIRYNLDTGEGNQHTIMRNCASDGINIGKWDPLTCINSNNWDSRKKGGSMLKFHPAADLLDFRPKSSSPLINAGYHIEGINDHYLGSSPDIGAYEWGDDTYWIPGFREETTSLPIPYNEAVNLPIDRDLIFRHAYQSTSANVYVGLKEQSVITADQSVSKTPKNANLEEGDIVLIQLSEGRNIVTPTMIYGNPDNYDPAPYLLTDDPRVTLTPNTTYYWRADAVMKDGSIRKGTVWEFTTGEMSYLTEMKLFGKNDSEVFPLEGVTVLFSDDILLTDSKGANTGNRQQPGTYQYRLKKKGFATLLKEISIHNDTLIRDTLVQEYYDLTINIQDADMGIPIQGVLVTLNGEHFISDSTGLLKIYSNEYGFYNLEFSAESYLPTQIENLELNSDSILYTSLVRNYQNASFKIIDTATGTPIQYAILISRQGESIISDISGSINMSKVLPGWWHYKVEHNNYFTIEDSVYIDTTLSEYVIEMVRLKANITIIVRNDTGTIENAKIKFGDWTTTTTNQGKAWFYFVPAREKYSYSSEKEGYKSLYDSIFITIDTTINIHMQSITSRNRSVADNVEIFPNPASAQLTIKGLPGNVQVSLLRADGAVLKMINNCDSTCVLDLSNYPAGFYYLRIIMDDILKIEKISKI